MLTDEDIVKLMRVLATKQDLEEFAKKADLNELTYGLLAMAHGLKKKKSS